MSDLASRVTSHMSIRFASFAVTTSCALSNLPLSTTLPAGFPIRLNRNPGGKASGALAVLVLSGPSAALASSVPAEVQERRSASARTLHDHEKHRLTGATHGILRVTGWGLGREWDGDELFGHFASGGLMNRTVPSSPAAASTLPFGSYASAYTPVSEERSPEASPRWCSAHPAASCPPRVRAAFPSMCDDVGRHLRVEIVVVKVHRPVTIQ